MKKSFHSFVSCRSFTLAALAASLVACGSGQDDLLADEIGSSEAALSGYDQETKRCGDFRETALVKWTEVDGQTIRFDSAEIWQQKLDGAFARGLDFRIQVRVASEGGYLLWSTGTRSTSDVGVCYSSNGQGGPACALTGIRSMPKLYASRSARPYVRFTAGKDGDGVASCTWNIWPLERG